MESTHSGVATFATFATFGVRYRIHRGFGEASAICLKSDLFVAAQKRKREKKRKGHKCLWVFTALTRRNSLN